MSEDIKNWNESAEHAEMIKLRQPLERFIAHCTNKYQKDLVYSGNRVTIPVEGLVNANMFKLDATYAAGGKDYNGITIGTDGAYTGKDILQWHTPSTAGVPKTFVSFDVNMGCTWKYGVGDVDKAIAESGHKNTIPEWRTATAKATLRSEEKYVADTIFGKLSSRAPIDVYNSSKEIIIDHDPSATEVTENKVCLLDVIDNVLEYLGNKFINPEETLVAECDLKTYKYLRKLLARLATDNTNQLKNYRCQVYNNIEFVPSVLCKYNGSPIIDIRTPDAVAFVRPEYVNEAYRAHPGHGDMVEGYEIFDAAVIKGQELITLAPKFA